MEEAAIMRAERAVNRQRNWIEQHGGDASGYNLRYQNADRLPGYADAIYISDVKELIRRQNHLAFLHEKGIAIRELLRIFASPVGYLSEACDAGACGMCSWRNSKRRPLSCTCSCHGDAGP